MTNTLLSRIKLKFFKFISYSGIRGNESIENVFSRVLLNWYIFAIICILLCHFFSVLLILRVLSYRTIPLCLAILFFSFSYIFPDHVGKIYLRCIAYTIILFVVTFYSSACSFESGVMFNYFPLVLSLSAFFSLTKEKVYIFVLFILSLLCFLLTFKYDFSLFGNSEYILISRYYEKMMPINIVLCLALSLGNVFIIYDATNKMAQLNNTVKESKNTIKALELNFENIVKDRTKSFSDNDLVELMTLAKLNEMLFLEKYNYYFPHLFDKISSYTNISLLFSEKYFCALIMLGCNTKEISIITKSSIRAIDSRKYRLRKKLHLSSEVELTTWMQQL